MNKCSAVVHQVGCAIMGYDHISQLLKYDCFSSDFLKNVCSGFI